MYTVVRGDLLKTSCPILVQQSNCLTVRGKGLSSSISKAFPYADLYAQRVSLGGKNLATEETRGRPGTIEILKDPKGKGPQVACLLSQWAPGKGQYRYPGPHRDTPKKRIQWFMRCLCHLSMHMATEGITEVAFPYKIGCGLAGGDWIVYEEHLKKFAKDTGADVKVYRLS